MSALVTPAGHPARHGRHASTVTPEVDVHDERSTIAGSSCDVAPSCHDRSDSSHLAATTNVRIPSERDARISGDRDRSIRNERDTRLAELADDVVQAVAPLAAGYLALLSVETKGADDLAWWAARPTLMLPAVSWRSRRHAHGILHAFDALDADEALADYCAATGVPRGACDLSPVRGWRVLSRSTDKLRTNVFRILRYATDETRQGAIAFGAAVASLVFAEPWAHFVASRAPALWPRPASARPCRLAACDRLVSGRRETCSDAHRQEVSRHEDRDRRPWLRPRHAKLTSPVVVTSDAPTSKPTPPVGAPPMGMGLRAGYSPGGVGFGAEQHNPAEASERRT